MITNITLKNFKGFRHLGIFPKLVTVLIGPNGTGKSSVLQSLVLLKQWSMEDDRRSLDLNGHLIAMSAGDFPSRVSEASPMATQLSFAGQFVIDVGKENAPAEFQVALEFDADARLIFKRAAANCVYLGENASAVSPASNESAWTSSFGRSIELQDISGLHIAHAPRMGQLSSDERQVFSHLLASPTLLLRQTKVVPAIRGLGRMVYGLGGQLHDDIALAQGLGAQEDALATTMAYSETPMNRASDWMKQVTGVGIKARLIPPQSVQPVSTTTFGETGLNAEGFGTNALAQLLFDLARAENGATILIEEPEIHLHPGAQAELASVIAGEAKALNKQVIMTTHSEHIAGRLLIEVAEGKLSPEDIAIFSFEKDENGVCSASEIEVSENGQVAGGLRSFFQTDLDEMRRYVDALRAKA